jgi:NAD(P)-dependent dehydrogenase (short-subunit alcohol dehydrogenase family)
MSKTIVICGYGPGISAAVAKRFGREKFQVALVARNAERLAAGVTALEAGGHSRRGVSGGLEPRSRGRARG